MCTDREAGVSSVRGARRAIVAGHRLPFRKRLRLPGPGDSLTILEASSLGRPCRGGALLLLKVDGGRLPGLPRLRFEERRFAAGAIGR